MFKILLTILISSILSLSLLGCITRTEFVNVNDELFRNIEIEEFKPIELNEAADITKNYLELYRSYLYNYNILKSLKQNSITTN